MKIIAIIQARTGSTRLPNKVFLPLEGKAILLHVVDRVLQSKYIQEVIVATTTNPKDEKIVELFKNYRPNVFVTRGSEEDVLDRYYQAAKEYGAEIVVRITSDNPMIDPGVIDRVIKEFLDRPGLDYASTNIGQHTFPRGTDAEVVRFSTLEKVWQTATEPIDREHVTIHIKRFPEKFKTHGVRNEIDLSFHRWTVDEEADYKLAQEIYRRLYAKNPNFRIADVLKLFAEDPNLIKINQDIEQQNSKY
jgi:spore coat polysaccharide biosynthesis protein SpsF